MISVDISVDASVGISVATRSSIDRVSVDTSIDVYLADDAELAKIRRYHASLSAIMVL